ncbi:peptidase domain-containing protein [Methanoregula sp.]|uniref:peptidase domain-containing protein n=1 Tax=Methanoregula sp. TaxID=2052170 RepID=UPI00261CF095|nr:peptidase domain-containing protein [Methanoregula sp.]MDD5142363.1 peptidase domain-containing protein [Methanoregula sp.]
MKVHWLPLLVIVGLALAIPAVSAKVVEEKDGYVVTTVDTTQRFATFSSLTSYSLTQGQTRWHTTYVPSGSTTFISDLNWGQPSNSLSLTFYTPDISILGPYYDAADGVIDGRIHLMVYRSTGLSSGTWSSKVYGSSIAGTQTYSYSASGY